MSVQPEPEHQQKQVIVVNRDNMTDVLNAVGAWLSYFIISCLLVFGKLITLGHSLWIIVVSVLSEQVKSGLIPETLPWTGYALLAIIFIRAITKTIF